MGRRDIEAFIAQLLATKSSSTAATRYHGLQQLFRWLEDEGEIERSPMAKMQPPSVSEKASGSLAGSGARAVADGVPRWRWTEGP